MSIVDFTFSPEHALEHLQNTKKKESQKRSYSFSSKIPQSTLSSDVSQSAMNSFDYGVTSMHAVSSIFTTTIRHNNNGESNTLRICCEKLYENCCKEFAIGQRRCCAKSSSVLDANHTLRRMGDGANSQIIILVSSPSPSSTSYVAKGTVTFAGNKIQTYRFTKPTFRIHAGLLPPQPPLSAHTFDTIVSATKAEGEEEDVTMNSYNTQFGYSTWQFVCDTNDRIVSSLTTLENDEKDSKEKTVSGQDLRTRTKRLLEILEGKL